MRRRGTGTRIASGGRLVRLAALLGTVLLLGARAPQRGGPRVGATLESGVVRVGERSSITVYCEGSTGAQLGDLPQVKGLQFGPPQPSTLQSIVNGRMSVEMRWGIGFRATDEGTYTIPPFTVVVDGKELQTRSLEVTVVNDIRGADLGFLEVKPSADTVVEGQPLSIEVRIGLDAGAGINFATPILPWWVEMPGTVELEGRPLAPGTRTVQLSVNGEVDVQAESLPDEERNGRTFHVYRLERRVLPTRPGDLELPRSNVRFGRMRERQGFLTTRQEIVDDYFVGAPAVTVKVLPLPTDGQPIDFGGAVGTLEARARADTRDVRAGDSIKLTVDWTGDGNLEFFDPPDLATLDAFRGFRVLGKTEEKSADRRRVTYDVAPLSEDVQSIPAVPLTVYDPGKEAYVRITTDPIPIRVRPLENPTELEAQKGPTTALDVRDIDARPLDLGVAPPLDVPGNGAVAGALLGLPLLLLGLRVVVRRRRGDPGAPLERRRRRAPRALARALARDASPSRALAAFDAYLAARTREPETAWEGRDLRLWSAERDGEALPADAVARVEDLRSRLEAAVFGGGRAVPVEEVLATARMAKEAGL